MAPLIFPRGTYPELGNDRQTFKMGVAPNSALPYMGFVSNKSSIPQNNQPALHYGNSRQFMYARDNINQCKLVFPNWRGGEVSTGGIFTISASIEYPANNFTQLTFGGLPTAVIPDLTNITTDLVTLTTPIPDGAMFWVRTFQSSTTQLIFNSGGNLYTPNGDALEYSATIIADKTLTPGALTNNAGGAPYSCLGVIGLTSKPSFVLFGDSRILDGIDTPDSTGDIADTARSIGGTYGYSNCGASGEVAAGFATANNANRKLMLQYCSHVICGYGVNDIQSGATAANLEASLNTIWGFCTGKKLYQETIAPKTLSSDTWATLANQTAAANFPLTGTGVRNVVNTYILGLPSPLFGTLDIASVVSTSSFNDYWQVPGITGDGIHETHTGCINIKNSGVINPASFTR